MVTEQQQNDIVMYWFYVILFSSNIVDTLSLWLEKDNLIELIIVPMQNYCVHPER